MLYIASALPSTAVTHAITVPNFTSDVEGAASLVVAKGNAIEVWDLTPEGLVEICKTDVWGMVVGLEWVGKPGQKPHIIALTDHPLARLLLYRFLPSPSSPSLDLTASQTINRHSRTAEFLTGLVADRTGGVVVASLYVGLLSVIEIGAKEKEDGKGRRGSMAGGKGKKRERKESGDVDMEVAVEEGNGDELAFKEYYEVNIREHNLLSLAFNPSPSAALAPRSHSILTFLYLTPDYTINLSARKIDRSSRSFTDLCPTVDILAPPSDSNAGMADYGIIAAKKLLSIPGGVLVMGDEYSACYALQPAPRQSIGSSRRDSGASAASRDPKLSPELTKRRKGSIGGSYIQSPPGTKAGVVEEQKWKLARRWKVRQGFGDITGAATIPLKDRNAVLLGDSAGRLNLLTYSSQPGPTSHTIENIGRGPAASSITYLDNGHVFIGSERGDSQIIRLEGNARTGVKGKGKGKSSADLMQIDEEEDGGPSDKAKIGASFATVDSWANIAPVMDFCVVEDQGGGSSQIVTASGVSPTGSLRTIRSGVGTELVAKVEGISGVTGLFPFTFGAKSGGSGIAITTSDATYFAKLTGSSTEEGVNVDVDVIDPQALSYESSTPTVAVGQIGDNVIAQVTQARLVVIDLSTSGRVTQWSSDNPSQVIVAAAFSGSHVLLGLTGGKAVLLKVIVDGTSAIETLGSGSFSNEIASLALAPFAGSGDVPQFGAIGLWSSNEVKIVALPGFEVMASTAERSLPRSILIQEGDSSAADSQAALMVGLGDGTLAARTVVSSNSPALSIEVGGLKPLALGRTPINLSTGSTAEGHVLAVSDRISVLYRDQDRLSHSSLNASNASTAALLSLGDIGSVIVLHVDNALEIRLVSSLKKLHIRKIDLGYDSPVALRYHPAARVFGVALNRTVIDGDSGEEVNSSYFRLYDAETFIPTAEVPLNDGERPVCLSLVPAADGDELVFALGSTYDNEPSDSGSSSKGCVRLIRVSTDTNPDALASVTVLVSHRVSGTVYDIRSIWGKIAVAVDHKVDLLDPASIQAGQMAVTATWGNAFYISALSVQRRLGVDGTYKERLHVGDGMRSVSVLELDASGELIDTARDFRPHWVLTMDELDAEGGGLAFSDTNYNILTIREHGPKLENAAGLAWHETVTKFQRGSLVPATGHASLDPELLFATSSGRLGVIADLKPLESKVLREVQLNMESLVAGPEMTWSRYREIHTEGNAKPRPAVGFIDGDFVKRYMDYAPTHELAQLILDGPNEFSRVGMGAGQNGERASRADVVQILEAVGSIHR